MSRQATMIDSSLMIARGNSLNIAVHLLRQAAHVIPLKEPPMFPGADSTTLARSLPADTEHPQGHLSRSALALPNLKPLSYPVERCVTAAGKD